MRTFEVEDDLVALVWARANPQPFEQLTFSDALRRVLDAPKHTGARTEKPAVDGLPSLAFRPREGTRKRAPKTDLRTLVRLGRLRDGQELVLVDYRRQLLREFRATITEGDLWYDGRTSSMSALAEALLKKKGYVSDSVRGPDHWATTDGKLVSELWQDVLVASSRTA